VHIHGGEDGVLVHRLTSFTREHLKHDDLLGIAGIEVIGSAGEKLA
jgi:hypothetical protein